MRKIFLLLGVVGISAMGASFAACSSDDSTATPGVDSGTADTYVPPTDSGPGNDGSIPPVDAGPCTHCAQLLEGKGTVSTACPASLALAFTAIKCACASSAAGAGAGKCDIGSDAGYSDGGAPCAAYCPNAATEVPNPTCQQCGIDKCSDSFVACVQDTDGTDAVDAGPDSGDGG